MRDIVVLALVFGSLPFCFARPFIGALVWTWISFMAPHRLAWGVAREAPVALLIALATLAGAALTRDRLRFPRSAGTTLLIVVWILLTASTLTAADPSMSYPAWIERSKILLMLLVTIALVDDRSRLRWLCLVTALSIGFYGVRGGIFTIITGGEHRVYGPDGTFLYGNNAIGLALNMMLPFLFYLPRELDRRWRAACWIAFALSVLAIAATYSRGAILGLGVVLTLLYWKSGRKVLGSVLLAIGFCALVLWLPAKWSQRMDTIQTYEQDMSAMSRLNAWKLAWRLARARPVLGWGPQAMEDKTLYDRYFPESPTRADVHSTYLQLMAENGFPCFLVFVGLLVWCFRRLYAVATVFRDAGEQAWLSRYADMFQVSLAGFVVSGAFLENAFFDLLFHLIGTTIVLDVMARQLQPAAVAARPLAGTRLWRAAEAR